MNVLEGKKEEEVVKECEQPQKEILVENEVKAERNEVADEIKKLRKEGRRERNIVEIEAKIKIKRWRHLQFLRDCLWRRFINSIRRSNCVFGYSLISQFPQRFCLPEANDSKAGGFLSFHEQVVSKSVWCVV